MPFNTITTLFPGGLTNAHPAQVMAKAGTPDPTWSQLYHTDFNTFATTDLAVSGQGTPAVTLSTAYGAGGYLQGTTTALLNDAAFAAVPTASFALTALKQHFFKVKVQVSDAINSTFMAGLAPVSANPTAAADGLFFLKASGQTGLVLRSAVGGVNTDTPLPAACVMANGVNVELGFHVDAQGNVEVFFNAPTGNNPANPNNGIYRGRVASGAALSLTGVMLSPSLGLVSTTASAKTFAADFLTMSSER